MKTRHMKASGPFVLSNGIPAHPVADLATKSHRRPNCFRCSTTTTKGGKCTIRSKASPSAQTSARPRSQHTLFLCLNVNTTGGLVNPTDPMHARSKGPAEWADLFFVKVKALASASEQPM